MSERGGRTTIDDVAAQAGVSIKTVSRVMNDEPGVRAETRQRVREVMTALNYQPSLPARSLAGRRSNLIGLVYENPSAHYVFDVQSGAMAKCREANLRLFVQSCNELGESMLPEILAMLDQTHVDGLVLTPPLSSNRKLIAALDQRSIPFVRMAPDDLDHPSPLVEMDDEAAAREMTAYLLELGHKDVAFIAGHPDHYSSALRLRGYRAERAARRRWLVGSDSHGSTPGLRGASCVPGGSSPISSWRANQRSRAASHPSSNRPRQRCR